MLSAGGYRQNLLDRPVAAEGVLFLAAYLWAVWNEAGYGYRFFLYALSVVFLLLYFYRKHLRGGGRQKEIYIPYYMYAAIAVILVQWIVKIVRMLLLII